MRKLRLVAAAVALVASAAVGATFAEYFSTQGTSGSLESGTLVLELKDRGGETPLPKWEIKSLAPDVHPHHGLQYRTLQIHNRGTVDAALYYQAIELTDYENGCTPPERRVDSTCDPEQGELSQQLEMTIERRPYRYGCVHQLVPNDHMWPLGDIAGTERGGDVTVAAGTFVCMEVHFRVPDTDKNNLVQSDSSSFRMQFTLKSTAPSP